MSQQAVREHRKELRRAIGTQAIADLDYLTEMLVKHEARLNAIEASHVETMTLSTNRLQQLEDDYWRDHATRAQHAADFSTSLWTRLRLLLMGH